MTKEEQPGVPPMEVMRQLLDENKALIRLLSGDTINGAEREPCAETDPADVLVSVYRELLELLEILSSTYAPRTGEQVSGR